ncbi:MAG: ribosome-associated translation inhibitor RaiA [Oscillospiraceae bacterium]|nr:ribosome-associated translation inhibitor RaiA [Oscillospiraceae bacterium]
MNNIKITGKDLKATDAIKEYVEKKIERLEKYFGEDFDVAVVIRAEKGEQIAEITVKAKENIYRAVTAHRDMYASIDKDIDILEGQIRKVKTKKDKANKEDSIKTMMTPNETAVEVENEIIKTLYYDLKPITPEDALLKLQENPVAKFLTFINQDTNKVNVVYKLKDSKNYGLVEPE